MHKIKKILKIFSFILNIKKLNSLEEKLIIIFFFMRKLDFLMFLRKVMQ